LANLILLKSTLVDALALLAAEGFVPKKQEEVSDLAVRLYFPEVESPEDTRRLFVSVPFAMHAAFAAGFRK
jgi:hypothetical protein